MWQKFTFETRVFCSQRLINRKFYHIKLTDEISMLNYILTRKSQSLYYEIDHHKLVVAYTDSPWQGWTTNRFKVELYVGTPQLAVASMNVLEQ